MKILVVDDEPSLRESLRYLLEQAAYEVCTADTGSRGLELAQSWQPDLILLDVMLPGMDGFEVCRRLRGADFSGIILLLTARDQEIDQVQGLELGADDYIVKPFRHLELLARIKAHLRRLQRQAEPVLSSGELEVSNHRHEVWRSGQKLDLTPKEFALLLFLLENRRKAQTRERILAACWGYEFEGEARVVNVTVQRLREKIEADPAHPRYLVTVRGVGYMWDV
ncbi:response regulator transcription factor [bacterium]|nr:response regulator transcription factor [bacterium]